MVSILIVYAIMVEVARVIQIVRKNHETPMHTHTCLHLRVETKDVHSTAFSSVEMRVCAQLILRRVQTHYANTN